MGDIVAVLRAFGSSGDPTMNVSVTNWPTTIQTIPATNSTRYVFINPTFNISTPYEALPAIDTKGYRKIYFYLTGGPSNYICNLTIGWRTQGAFNSSSQDWWGQIEHYEDRETGIYGSAWREFDIKGETMIIILGDTMGTQSYEVSYYMTG